MADKKWEESKDEIPGYSSWLTYANRLRDPWEFPNWETERQRIQIRLDSLKDKLNWNEEITLNFHIFIDIIEEAYSEARKLNKKFLKILEQLNIYDHSLKNAKEGLRKGLRNEKNLKAQLELANIQKKDALNFCLEYGRHKTDCKWIEALQIGRILSGGEKKHCTCGWLEIKKGIEK